ncbi:MAG TPA: amidohydrolase family protein [Candidatus Binatia bacterium]|jgi:aminocarboxymuconate-semialdehyde decarboxylase|nr:amidohydrolase family protein [Candidatus Binatia bacterium]
MRIDVHAHIFSSAYIDGLRRVFGNDNSPAGQDAQRLIKWMSTDPRMTDVEGRLEEMEKWGIAMQVLSVPFHGALVQDQSAAVDLTNMANEMILRPARAYPERFRVLLTLPLQFPEFAVEVLDRFAKEPNVVGVALMGTAGGRPLNDPAFIPVYTELERRALPFLLHPISPPGLDCMLELNLANVVGFMFETTLAATRLVFAGVFERHPKLQMIFPHLGGLAPYLMGRIQWGYERFPACNEHLSAPPEFYFKRFYYDTVCRNVPALRMALSMFGVEHVLFGTDIPFREDIDLQLQDLEALQLNDAERRAIDAGNAARLLGIKIESNN